MRKTFATHIQKMGIDPDIGDRIYDTGTHMRVIERHLTVAEKLVSNMSQLYTTSIHARRSRGKVSQRYVSEYDNNIPIITTAIESAVAAINAAPFLSKKEVARYMKRVQVITENYEDIPSHVGPSPHQTMQEREFYNLLSHLEYILDMLENGEPLHQSYDILLTQMAKLKVILDNESGGELRDTMTMDYNWILNKIMNSGVL